MLARERVMVTGASGKLGGPLCAALLAEGYSVIAVNRRWPVDVAGVEEVRADVGDAAAMEALVGRSDAVIHLATCKEDREAVIKTSAQGTFNLLDAIARGKAAQAVHLGQRRRGQRDLLQPPAGAHPRRHADGGLSGLLPALEGRRGDDAQQYHHQPGVPTVTLRMSWIHAEDDILTHLTVADPQFGVPVWRELMGDSQRARFQGGGDAVVALRHPDGRPCAATSWPWRTACRLFCWPCDSTGSRGRPS